MDQAFKSFFNKNTSYSNFKSKKYNQYFIVPAGFKVYDNRLIIPNFIEGIKFRDKAEIPEKIKQIIVTKEVDRYYASIQYEYNEELPKGNGAVDIDFVIKNFINISDGS